MTRMVAVGVLLILTSCGRTSAPDTVQSLVAHPDRLREVERQCSDNYAKIGAAECNVASEARHRFFMGNGPKYTPPKDPPKF